MRLVLDSNCLQSDETRSFLSESNLNFVILTEYAAIEAYKGNDYSTIYESMSLISDFPNQVIIPKNTIDLCGMNLLEDELPNILINEEETKQFPNFSTQLIESKQNSSLYKEAANFQMSRIRLDAPKLIEGFKGVEKTYQSSDIKKLRKGNISEGFFDKLVENSLTTTAFLMRDHPSVNKIPELNLLPNNFLFRNAVCFQVLLMRWVSKGSPNQFKLEKTVNDIIDMNFVVYALYFDGIMSNDKKLIEVYEDAKLLLDIIKTSFQES